jgi:hypothetical protein
VPLPDGVVKVNQLQQICCINAFFVEKKVGQPETQENENL